MSIRPASPLDQSSAPYECAFSEFSISERSISERSIAAASGSNTNEASPTASRVQLFSAFSIGQAPGIMVSLLVEGARESLGSQIAVKLSYEAMLQTALEKGINLSGEPIDIVQEALKAANQRVYQYAHRMLSGGKVWARGFIAVYDGQRVSIGQVGSFETLLYRDGKLLRFHEPEEESAKEREGILERFIGANAQILVDLASVRVKDTDIIIFTSLTPSEELLKHIHLALTKMTSLPDACQYLTDQLLYGQLSQRSTDTVESSRPVIFMLQVGPPTIVLRHMVGDQAHLANGEL